MRLESRQGAGAVPGRGHCGCLGTGSFGWRPLLGSELYYEAGTAQRWVGEAACGVRALWGAACVVAAGAGWGSAYEDCCPR